MLEILNEDLDTLDVTFTALEAGQDSDVVIFALRNPSESDARDVLLILQTEDPETPGTWLSTGLPPQDEMWGRVRLTDQDNSAAPAQQPLRTDWTPLGAYGAFLVRDVLAGGIRFGEIKMRPPGSAAAVSYRWSLAVIESEHSRPLPTALTLTRRGILTRVGDSSHSALVHGFEPTPSDPPDDEVHVAAGYWLHRGLPRAHSATTHTLDQTDGAAEALAVGESYWAALSLGEAGVTVTKGTKGSSPAKPAIPEGDVLVRYVAVAYNAGGSEIDAADLDGRTLRDRYLAEPGTGLELVVHPGQALGGGTWRYHGEAQSLAVPGESTRWLWQAVNGDLLLTDSVTPPDAGALGPWYRVVTDVTGIVTLEDLRTYDTGVEVLRLGGLLPDDPGDVDALLVYQDALAVEQVIYRISDNGGGSSGATELDLTLNGDSVHGDPVSLTFDATELRLTVSHELAEIRAGAELVLTATTYPTGGTPARAEVYLLCRRIS